MYVEVYSQDQENAAYLQQNKEQTSNKTVLIEPVRKMDAKEKIRLLKLKFRKQPI